MGFYQYSIVGDCIISPIFLQEFIKESTNDKIKCDGHENASYDRKNSFRSEEKKSHDKCNPPKDEAEGDYEKIHPVENTPWIWLPGPQNTFIIQELFFKYFQHMIFHTIFLPVLYGRCFLTLKESLKWY